MKTVCEKKSAPCSHTCSGRGTPKSGNYKNISDTNNVSWIGLDYWNQLKGLYFDWIECCYLHIIYDDTISLLKKRNYRSNNYILD